MIASPSDVSEERRIIRDVIHHWNSINSEDKKIVLMPVGWETHSAPSMEGQAQDVINKQVLADCDLLVAAFWTRLGSPTGSSPSGTVEEIKRHLNLKKPTMIYFSSARVTPDQVDYQQYSALQEFKEWCESNGLIDKYDTAEEFRKKFDRQLAQTVIRDFAGAPEHLGNNSAGGTIVVSPPALPLLSDAAKWLLIEAAKDVDGIVIRSKTMGGLIIKTNGRNIVSPQDPRSEARWDDALDELCKENLLRDKNMHGRVYQVTNYGYEMADKLAREETA